MYINIHVTYLDMQIFVFLNYVNYVFCNDFFFQRSPNTLFTNPFLPLPGHSARLYFPTFLAVSYMWPCDQVPCQWYVGRGNVHPLQAEPIKAPKKKVCLSLSGKDPGKSSKILRDTEPIDGRTPGSPWPHGKEYPPSPQPHSPILDCEVNNK